MTLCLLFCILVKTSAAQYEVDGQIEQTIYKLDGSVQSKSKSQFTVFVNDCSWLIRTTNFDVNGTPLKVNETASTNGGVIYSLDLPFNKNTPIGGVSIWNEANIYSNDVPIGETDGDYISHLWLMFASVCHLKNLSTNWLTPVYNPNSWSSVNSPTKRWTKWELSSGPSSLPTNMTFFENGADSPIDATYAATGVTNVGGLKILDGFVFEQRVAVLFAPGPIEPGESNPAYHIRKRAVATVTAVRPSCSRASFVPTATGITRIADERLARVPNSNGRMYYIFQDGLRWVSVLEAKRLVAAQSQPGNPPSKAIVVIILLLPAAVVLFLWLLNRSKGPTVIHPNCS